MNRRLVPKLRFKGFNDEWTTTRLKYIVKRITRKNKNLDSNLPLTISAQHGLVNQRDFFTKQVTSKNIDNYYLLKKGDFAYNKSYSNKSPWGAIKRLDLYSKGILSTLYIVFRPINVNSNFLKFYYNTSVWHKEISRYAQEGARQHGLLNISVLDFFNSILNISNNKSEQQYIGTFFAKLDHMIKLQSKKLEHLKKLKKGYLQKMFPQKGENIPRLRFNGFHNEWDKKKLKDISNSVGGTALEKYFHSNGQYKVISIGSYGLDNEYIDQGIRAIANKKVNSKIVNKGNLTMVLNDKTKGRILGKTLLITENNKYVINQRSEIIKPNSNINSLFLYFQINAPYFHRALLSVAQGGTQIYVNYNSISKLTLSIPNIQEQNKIGQFFKNIDCSINQQDNKLTQIKELKKAYLQKMFC